MFTTLRNVLKDESGATAIEYGLIAGLISVAAIGAMGLMGGALNTMFTAVKDALLLAVNGAPAP